MLCDAVVGAGGCWFFITKPDCLMDMVFVILLASPRCLWVACNSVLAAVCLGIC